MRFLTRNEMFQWNTGKTSRQKLFIYEKFHWNKCHSLVLVDLCCDCLCHQKMRRRSLPYAYYSMPAVPLNA